MKKIVLLVFLLIPASSFAQGWAGETEIGTTNKREDFASQYLFYHGKKIDVLTRYFWVNKTLQRGEFAFGPVISIGRTTIQTNFGLTTDRDVMTAFTVLTKAGNHDIIYIFDGKISTTDLPSTLYQKFFLGLDQKGIILFRIESLTAGGEQAFLRIGAEYQFRLPKQTHIYLAPFGDPVAKGWGCQIGFRFF